MSKSSKKMSMVTIPTCEYRYLITNAFRANRVGDWLAEQTKDYASIEPLKMLFSDKLSIEAILDSSEEDF